MRRKFFLAAGVLGVWALTGGLLTGCGKIKPVPIKKIFTISLGDEVSSNPADYLRASKSILENTTIDVSMVNKEKIGIYKASLEYEGETVYFDIEVADLNSPGIVLKNDDITIEADSVLTIDMVVDSVTDESGVVYGFSDKMTAADKDKTILKELKLSEGEHRAEVIARDEYNNYSVKEIDVHVINTASGRPADSEKKDYSKYMNTSKGRELTDFDEYDDGGLYYGVGNTVDKDNRPQLTYYTKLYGDFRLDFIQPKSKYVWLTFNEVFERGYTEAILDTLKEKKVSAVFFITKDYAQKNPELVRRMIDEGHVLGNYTANCVNVPDLQLNELTNELNELYNYIYQTFGYEMYLFRPPSGYFSERSLAVAQHLGYRIVFWSFAYADWDADDQPAVDEALKNALDRVHQGAIYLLSGSSETNKEMLGELIDGIREKKLDFGVYQNN